jgi:hypothetical protein
MDGKRTLRIQYRATGVAALLLALAVSGSASASVPTASAAAGSPQEASATATDELAAAEQVALERATVARAAKVRAEQLEAQAVQAAFARDAAEKAAAGGRSRAGAATKVRVDLAIRLVQARTAVTKAKTSGARRTSTERVRVLQLRYDAAVKAERTAVSGARALNVTRQRRAQAAADAEARAAAAWQGAEVAQEQADEAAELVEQIKRRQALPVAPRPDPLPAELAARLLTGERIAKWSEWMPNGGELADYQVAVSNIRVGWGSGYDLTARATVTNPMNVRVRADLVLVAVDAVGGSSGLYGSSHAVSACLPPGGSASMTWQMEHAQQFMKGWADFQAYDNGSVAGC